MKLLDYLKALPDEASREAFSVRCGSSYGYLRLVGYGHKKCGEGLAIKIDRESEGKVPCEELCPGVDWAYLRASDTGLSADDHPGRRADDAKASA